MEENSDYVNRGSKQEVVFRDMLEFKTIITGVIKAAFLVCRSHKLLIGQGRPSTNERYIFEKTTQFSLFHMVISVFQMNLNNNNPCIAKYYATSIASNNHPMLLVVSSGWKTKITSH